MDVKTNHNITLASGEIATLWDVYMQDSMSVCVLRYFLEQVEDMETRPVIEFAYHTAQKQMQKIYEIFTEEEIPIPDGFKEEDVNLKAPRLYSDIFFMRYLKHMAQVSLGLHGMSLAIMDRLDIREFFSQCLKSADSLYNKTVDVMLSKGTYIRTPYISKPDKVEYIQKQKFIDGFLGDTRPLLAMEITHLSRNIETNSIAQRLLTGFSQTAQSDEIRKYMLRGKTIAIKHIEVLTNLFKKDELPVPATWDSVVTGSTVAPFSDRLMIFHVAVLASVGIGNYGMGISTSMRRDIVTMYTRLLTESGKFTEDGLNIMIENGWMEQPPQALDRNALTQK